MVRLIIRPAAGTDLREATRWYEEESPGLGDRFLDDLRGTQARSTQSPSPAGGRRRAAIVGAFQDCIAATSPDREDLSSLREERNGRPVVSTARATKISASKFRAAYC